MGEESKKRSKIRLRRQQRLDYKEHWIGPVESDSDSSDSDAPLTWLKRRKQARDGLTCGSSVSLPLGDSRAKIKRPRPRTDIQHDVVEKTLGVQEDAEQDVGPTIKNDSNEDDPVPTSTIRNLRDHSRAGTKGSGSSMRDPIILDEPLPVRAPMPTPPESTRAPSSRVETKTETDEKELMVEPLRFVFQRVSTCLNRTESPPQPIANVAELFFHAMCNNIATRSTARLQVSYAGRVHYLCRDNEEYFDNFIAEVRHRVNVDDHIGTGYPRVEPYE